MYTPFNYWVGRPLVPEGFVICFVKVPLACLNAWAAWHLQYSPTVWGTLRKQFTKPSEQVAAPPSILMFLQSTQATCHMSDMTCYSNEVSLVRPVTAEQGVA